MGARSTHQAPSGNRPPASEAARIASRVLPHPPAPISAVRRCSAKSSLMSASSRFLPTKLESSTGRLPGAASRVDEGENPDRRSAPTSLSFASLIATERPPPFVTLAARRSQNGPLNEGYPH